MHEINLSELTFFILRYQLCLLLFQALVLVAQLGDDDVVVDFQMGHFFE